MQFTASHDKMINVLEVKNSNEVKFTDDSNTVSLTCMALHDTDGTGLVGTSSRKIQVYDFKASPPTLVTELTGHKGMTVSWWFENT